MTYALLLHPSFMRLYRDAAHRVAVNELAMLFPQAENPREETIGGVPYLCFDYNGGSADAMVNDAPARDAGLPQGVLDASMAMNEANLRVLSRLTFAYALFAVDGHRLLPLARNAAYFLDDSLSAMLKYVGKTNERFTRLLLQLPNALCRKLPATFSLATTAQADDTPLRILDPLCGKGTTLYEALMHGHHAYGIEADPQYPAEADRYLKKFLETARYKFTTHQERISGVFQPSSSDAAAAPRGKDKPQKFTATRHQVTLARDKDEMKTAPRQFEVIQGDTRHAAHFYKKHFFDAIVADLPYGVQHGAQPIRAKTPGGNITRNAAQLLLEALPQWRKVIKPNGAIVLSWNRFLIPRVQMEEILTAHGFTQPQEIAALDFSHRVDQAIDRDVIVGIIS